MAATPTTYTGKDAAIYIFSGTTAVADSVFAISDFSLTFDKGVVEQELVGETGNYRVGGSVSVEGSLTHCILDGSSYLIGALVNGNRVRVSGSCGTNSLHFYLVSCAVTGFDISIGDADTITEGSVDFQVMTPYQITITDGDGSHSGKYISNC